MDKDHSSIGFLVFFAVILNAPLSTHGLYCQSCDSISKARDCNTVIKCSSTSTCFHDSIVTSTGAITHRLGCRDRNTTKPDNVDSGSTVVCSETCSADLCSVKLCGDQDFPTPHGPICFSCRNMLATQNCDQFTICGRDQVCYEALSQPSGTIANGDLTLTMGCYPNQQCSIMHQMFGRRRRLTDPSCFTCCHDDFCNANCTAQLASHAGGCKDRSSASDCQMAAPYVCTDRTKADNAGCLKHCGFCPTAATSTVKQGCTDLTSVSTCKLAAHIVCSDRSKAQNAHCLHYCGFC